MEMMVVMMMPAFFCAGFKELAVAAKQGDIMLTSVACMTNYQMLLLGKLWNPATRYSASVCK